MGNDKNVLTPTLDTPQVDIDKDAIIDKLNKANVNLQETNKNLLKIITQQRKAISSLVQDMNTISSTATRSLEIVQTILESNVKGE